MRKFIIAEVDCSVLSNHIAWSVELAHADNFASAIAIAEKLWGQYMSTDPSFVTKNIIIHDGVNCY